MNPILLSLLGVDAALFDGEGYAIDGEHVGGDAVVDSVGFGVADHVVEAFGEDASSCSLTMASFQK